MGIPEILLPSVVGTLNLMLVGAILFLARLNARELGDVRTQHLVAISAVVFIIATLVHLVSLLKLEIQAAFVRPMYGIFLSGAVVLLAGLATSLARTWKFAKKGALRLPHVLPRFAAVVLLFLLLPCWGYSLITQTEIGAYGWGAMVSAAVFFFLLLLGENRLRSFIAPRAIVGGISDDRLLREDLRCFRAYSDLTNRFSAVIALSADIGFLRETLESTKEKYELVKDWEYDERGTLRNTEKSVGRLSRMSEERSLEVISSTFGALNSALIKLYGAITSPVLAKRTFESIYADVKAGYDSLPAFPRITVYLPSGVLDDERVRHTQREELEKLVRERTVELQRTIEELRRTAWGLDVAEKKFQGAIGLMPTPYIETDLDGHIAFLNPAGYDMFGFSARDLARGLTLKDLVAPEDREKVEGDLRAALGERRVISREHRVVKKDGRSFPALLRIAPITYADNPVGFRCVLLDITDRKLAREAERKGIIEILQKLKTIPMKRIPPFAAPPDRIRRLQLEAVELIRRELQKTKLRSPIIEAYKEFLGPLRRELIRERRKRKRA